jgi:phage terminase small subunit
MAKKAHGNAGQSKPLTATQAEFILEYEANGRNAARAYQRTHPNASMATSYVQGVRCLRSPKIARALEQLRKDRVKRLNMDADEAAMLTAITARADIRLAYDAEGKPLPPAEWPDEFAKAVKSIRADGSIVLHDSQKARETILLMAGKLKQTVDVNHFDHLAYLAGKTRTHKGKANGDGTTEETQSKGRHR